LGQSQNTVTEWVDLGVYPFDQGSTGTVTLTDLTGEPYSARHVVFFDAVKWVPERAPDPLNSRTYLPLTER
jgi:hypothetical protein